MECGGATESDENGEGYGAGTERKPKTDDGEGEEEQEKVAQRKRDEGIAEKGTGQPPGGES